MMRKIREGEMVATPRSLTGANNGAYLKLQRVPLDDMQKMTPRNKILPPLHTSPSAPGEASSSNKTLHQLVSSDSNIPRATSDRGFPKRLRVLEAHSKPGNPAARPPQIQLAGDMYDCAAAELFRSERSHRKASIQKETTPLENVRLYIRTHDNVQREGSPAEGIYKRQFCLPVHSVDTETVWSRPILVYGEGATGVSKEFPDSLAFDSAFESGNLLSAHRVGALEYELLLNPDHATTGHTQWYLFSVSNAVGGFTYNFHITNLNKPDSLYDAGQQPLFFSSHAFNRDGKGWQRIGKDVKYVKNGRRRNGRPLFTLSFAVEFPHDGDKCLLAHCFPYTFTDLTKYLKIQQLSASSQFHFDCDVLCHTLAGNACHLLTITAAGTHRELAARKGVFLSARVHPGESNSSLIMKGILDFLMGASAEAASLRSACVFKIIPMLNPDGVVNGHYRCNLAGYDLNRRWHLPSRKTHPTIYCAKEMLKEFCKEREVEVFVDIHGHSVKHNMFMYGCPAKPKSEDRLQGPSPKAFLQLLQTHSPYFSWRDSKFSVEKSKEHTGRVVAYRELDIQNSYTLEASLCGADDGKTSKHQFSAADFEAMGTAFCLTLAEYCSKFMQPNLRKSGTGSVLDRRESLQQLLTELAVAPAVASAQAGSAHPDSDGVTAASVHAPSSDNVAAAHDDAVDQGKKPEVLTSGAETFGAEDEVEENGGDSSSDDEDRILDLGGDHEEEAEAAVESTQPAQRKGNSDPKTQDSPRSSVPLTHLQIQIPGRARASLDSALPSVKLADWDEQDDRAAPSHGGPHGHSLIPFPPSEGAGGADGRRLVLWQPSPRFRERHTGVPAAARSPGAVVALPVREVRRERRGFDGGGCYTDRGGQSQHGRAAGGVVGEAGGALPPPPRSAAPDSWGGGGYGQTLRVSRPRGARTGAGPTAPRPPTMGGGQASPRQVVQQNYARESREQPPPSSAHAGFYPFPQQRRARHVPRGDVGEKVALAMQSSTGSAPYTGPPGIYVGGRWHHSTKPVGPSSKFLPIMLGAVQLT